jgi:hypothetical protein
LPQRSPWRRLGDTASDTLLRVVPGGRVGLRHVEGVGALRHDGFRRRAPSGYDFIGGPLAAAIVEIADFADDPDYWDWIRADPAD